VFRFIKAKFAFPLPMKRPGPDGGPASIAFASAQSEPAFATIWNNSENNAYDALEPAMPDNP
jgi:hypothetical protein